MKWKFVFNSSVGGKWWEEIDDAKQAAINGGYRFFSWNGKIYTTLGNETGITVDDCF